MLGLPVPARAQVAGTPQQNVGVRIQMLVRELRPKRALFTHISHLLGLHADVEAELPEGVGLAHDGMVVELPDP